MFGRVPGTRPNISESHSEISTRVPFCIEHHVDGPRPAARRRRAAAGARRGLWQSARAPHERTALRHETRSCARQQGGYAQWRVPNTGRGRHARASAGSLKWVEVCSILEESAAGEGGWGGGESFPNSGNWFHSTRHSTAELFNARSMEPRIE